MLCAGLLESVTENVSAVALATAVGVPLIVPAEALRLKPAGRVPLVSAHVYGIVPPLAASVTLYAVPIWPSGSDVVEIASGVGVTVCVVELLPPQPAIVPTVRLARINRSALDTPMRSAQRLRNEEKKLLWIISSPGTVFSFL